MTSSSSSRATSFRPDPRSPWRACLRRLLLCLLCAPALGAAAPVDELKGLLARGDARAAYERGRRYADQLGEPAFDYFYGIAAIDAGHAAEGTLALERYVITYPADRNARLELARGYFVMGDDARAREEFNGVLAAGPPPAVRANVQRYLDAITARESRRRTTLTLFAEAGAGFDSNVNGGVSSSLVNLPIGTVTIQSSGLKTGDGFATAAGGLQMTAPLTPAWSVFAGVNADTKNHFSRDPYDLRSLNVSVGAARLGTRDLVRVTGSAGSLLLDDNRFRDLQALSGEWFRTLDPATMVSASVQVARLGYTGDNAPRDADVVTLATGVRRAFDRPWQPALSGAISAGRESNRRERDDLGRDFYGVRAGLSVTPREGWDATVGLTAQRSEYLAEDTLLAATRRDWYAGLDGAVVRTLSRAWSVRAEWLAAINRSSIELYEYRRNMVLLKLRYDSR